MRRDGYLEDGGEEEERRGEGGGRRGEERSYVEWKLIRFRYGNLLIFGTKMMIFTIDLQKIQIHQNKSRFIKNVKPTHHKCPIDLSNQQGPAQNGQDQLSLPIPINSFIESSHLIPTYLFSFMTDDEYLFKQ